MEHQAIKAINDLAHVSHRWDEPWDNTRNDSRSDSWMVQCKKCFCSAIIYFEHPYDVPEIDPELLEPCVPFRVEDGELMAMARELDGLGRKYGMDKVREYFLANSAGSPAL